MQTHRERLQEAARELAARYDTIKSEAQRRLGSLFNASDYPTTLDGLFDLEVSYPTIESPNYLMALHPDVCQAEQARVRERFESAVELAEQAFATELQRLHWIDGRSGGCRSPGRATSSQTQRAAGGQTWGRQAGRCWGRSRVGPRRWGRRGGGWLAA
jgi:hypothetical protein